MPWRQGLWQDNVELDKAGNFAGRKEEVETPPVRYIDTCSFDDYDMVIRFLLKNNVTILSRNKLEMVVVAELPNELESRLWDEVEPSLEESLSIGGTSLG